MPTCNRRLGKGKQYEPKKRLQVVPYRVQFVTDTREGYPLAPGSIIYLIQETRFDRFFLYGYTLRSSAEFVSETMGEVTRARLDTHFVMSPDRVIPTQYDTGKVPA